MTRTGLRTSCDKKQVVWLVSCTLITQQSHTLTTLGSINLTSPVSSQCLARGLQDTSGCVCGSQRLSAGLLCSRREVCVWPQLSHKARQEAHF